MSTKAQRPEREPEPFVPPDSPDPVPEPKQQPATPEPIDKDFAPEPSKAAKSRASEGKACQFL